MSKIPRTYLFGTLGCLWVFAMVAVGEGSQLGSPADAAALEQGNRLAQQITMSDWLGPLAPIALSPFFGMACLSGLATYGPEWIPKQSGLLGPSSPLNNEPLFWAMAGLTILTSLPRLSKVSKPIGLAAEKLETYSVAVIFLLMKLLAHDSTGSTQPEVEVAMAGFSPIHVPVDLLLGIAAGLNIIVINAIKLFIELLVWLIPIPFVDAALEVTNKALCASLMGLYTYSPMLATMVNLVILAACSFVFLKVVRRIRLYRHLIAGPILGWIWPSMFGESDDRFVGFFEEATSGFPKYSKWEVARNADGSWELNSRSIWKSTRIQRGVCKAESTSGILKELVTLDDGKEPALRLIRRHQIKLGSFNPGGRRPNTAQAS